MTENWRCVKNLFQGHFYFKCTYPLVFSELGNSRRYVLRITGTIDFDKEKNSFYVIFTRRSKCIKKSQNIHTHSNTLLSSSELIVLIRYSKYEES